MPISQPKINPKRIRNARILVVEGNSDHCQFIKTAFQQTFTDAEAILTANEHEAIDYLKDCSQTGARLPQLILMDLYVPERENGWHLLKLIKKADPEIVQIPVVVFCNSSNPEDITESYERGVTSYVVKPKDFNDWLGYFQILKGYWWETVTLPDSYPLL
jgi:CheY-like chemotaxis protein